MSDERPCVLVAEDERALADLYAVWLADRCETRIVHDGAAAIEAFDERVDAAVLDRRMPERSGSEVLDHIREVRPACPAAMVSATDPDLHVADLGVDAYVRKPATREELTELVSTLLRLREADCETVRHHRLSRSLAAVESQRPPSALACDETYRALRAELCALDGD